MNGVEQYNVLCAAREAGYFDDCGSHDEAQTRLRSLLAGDFAIVWYVAYVEKELRPYFNTVGNR